MSEERTYIIETSLQHYSDKLVGMSLLEGLPELVKKDLINESTRVRVVLNIVETKGIAQPVWEETSVLQNKDYVKYICSALKSYLDTLERSLLKFKVEYGLNSIEMSLTNKSIELAKKTIEDIRPCKATEQNSSG